MTSADTVDPGTVMVLTESGKLGQSCQAYDKKVAGVITGAGDYKPGIILDKKEKVESSNRLPIALMGKTYCKVDATYGAIETGDLLGRSVLLSFVVLQWEVLCTLAWNYYAF